MLSPKLTPRSCTSGLDFTSLFSLLSSSLLPATSPPSPRPPHTIITPFFLQRQLLQHKSTTPLPSRVKPLRSHATSLPLISSQPLSSMNHVPSHFMAFTCAVSLHSSPHCFCFRPCALPGNLLLILQVSVKKAFLQGTFS